MKIYLKLSILWLVIISNLSGELKAALAPSTSESQFLEYEEDPEMGGRPVRNIPTLSERNISRLGFCESFQNGAHYLLSGLNNRTFGALGLTSMMGIQDADENPSIVDTIPSFTRSRRNSSKQVCSNSLISSVAAVTIVGGTIYFLLSETEEPGIDGHGRFLQDSSTVTSITAMGVAGVMLGNLGQDIWRWLAGILTRRNAPRELCEHVSLWCKACYSGVNHTYKEITPVELPHNIYTKTIDALGNISSLAETSSPHKYMPSMEVTSGGKELIFYFHRPVISTDDIGSSSGTLSRIIKVERYERPMINIAGNINHFFGRKAFLIRRTDRRIEDLLYNLIPDGEIPAREAMKSLLEALAAKNPSQLGIQTGKTKREVRISSKVTVPAERDFVFIHLFIPTEINMMGLKGDFMVPYLTFNVFNMSSTGSRSEGLLKLDGLRSIDSYSRKRNARFEGIIDTSLLVDNYLYYRSGLIKSGVAGAKTETSFSESPEFDADAKVSSAPRSGWVRTSSLGSDNDSVKSIESRTLSDSVQAAEEKK